MKNHFAKCDVREGTKVKANNTREIDVHLCTARGCVPGVSVIFVFAVASILFAILSFLLLRHLSPSHLNLDPSSCFNFTAGFPLALDPFRAASSRQYQIERRKARARESGKKTENQLLLVTKTGCKEERVQGRWDI